MKLKAVLETLDGLDAQYHDLYAKEGEKYVLQITGMDGHPTVQGLVSAKGRIAEDRDKLKPKAKAWDELVELRGEEDLTPTAVHDAIEAASGKAPKDVEERLKEAERRGAERAEAKAAKEMEKIQKRDETITGALRGRVVDGELRAALAKHGVLEKHRSMVEAYLRQRGLEMIEEDGAFRAVFRQDPDGIPRDLSPDEFVGSWVKTDEASAYMPAGGGGSGGKDSGGSAGGGRPGTMDGNDPLAWGQNAEKIAKGEMSVAHG